MKVRVTKTFFITPDTHGGVNEMKLTYHADEAKMIASEYRIHHWNDSLDELAGRLERMAKAIRSFDPGAALAAHGRGG